MLTTPMEITDGERLGLEQLVRTRAGRGDLARRARVLLLLAEGCSYEDIRASVGCSPNFISKWKQRFLEGRVGGLSARHRGRKAWVLTPRLRARILAWTRKPPRDGSTQWSTRNLAAVLGIDHLAVARTWWDAGLQPHRLERTCVPPTRRSKKRRRPTSSACTSMRRSMRPCSAWTRKARSRRSIA